MADRRIHRARLRLEREPPPISAKERAMLVAIERGYPGQEKVRKALVSKGLISSPIARLCIVTPLGRKAIKRPKTDLPEKREVDRYEQWYRKFANNGNPRKASC